MIESITFQDAGGIAPPITLTAPRDETTATTWISDAQGQTVQLCKSKETASALIHVSQGTVAIEAFMDGIQISPPTITEAEVESNEWCTRVPILPSTEGCSRLIYLRHGDKVIFSKLCIMKVGILPVTGSANERDPSVVQVGSSIPDKEDGASAKAQEGSFEALANVTDTVDQLAEMADLANKVITETPRGQRTHDALAIAEDSYLGYYANDVDLNAEYQEVGMPLFEGDSTILEPLSRNIRQSSGNKMSLDDEGEFVKATNTTPQRFSEQEEGSSLDKMEANIKSEMHTAIDSPTNSEDSTGRKRKRERMITYSKSAKSKRARTNHTSERAVTAVDDDAAADVEGSPASMGQKGSQTSRERSKDASPQAYRTRGGKAGYAGSPPRVMFSNSAVTDNTVVMKFFTSHGCKKVDQVGKPFDLLVVGRGELRKRSKLIMAVAQCKPIVTDEWLEQSAKAGRLLDVSDFAPRDPEREKEWGWSAAAGGSRDRPRDVLIGRAIYITPALRKEYNETKDYKDIEEIVKAAGAKRVVSKAAKDILKQEDVDGSAVILGKDRNDSDCISLITKGYDCFTRDFLPMSILRGEPQFKDASLRIFLEEERESAAEDMESMVVAVSPAKEEKTVMKRGRRL